MRLRMWMLDVAREQSPTLDHLRRFCDLTLDSGYNALGLYFEHRFAYPSTPWAHGVGCVTPEMILRLQDEYPSLPLVPLVNLLGHFEGMMYTEEGADFGEERFFGLQACPSNARFVEMGVRILDDVLSIFKSNLIHLGGDETAQLGKCPRCATRVKEWEAEGVVDGKARLYAEHFKPLIERVTAAGRVPGVWGDMFYEHPTALDILPKEAVIFDWQYFKPPLMGAVEHGFDVVACPALHTYNACWLHMPQSERNVADHVEAAIANDLMGVCVTTWECGLFGDYETVFPAIRAAGKMLSEPSPSGGGQGEGENSRLDIASEENLQANTLTPTPLPEGEGLPFERLDRAPNFEAAYGELGEAEREWARLMGVELQTCGTPFAFTGIRSSIKCRFLLYSNPFLLWLRDRDTLLGEAGEKAYAIAIRAAEIAPTAAMRGVSEFLQLAIEFVRHVEKARRAYGDRRPGEAIAALAPCRQIFDHLENVAKARHLRIGGSLADVERCRIARKHVETVIGRIKEYGDGALGYLPAFEILTHPKFVPHDQASWWLINKWANE